MRVRDRRGAPGEAGGEPLKPSEWRQVLGALGLLSQVGLTVVAGAALGGGLGHVLEGHVPAGGAWLVAGIVLGVIGGGLGAYRLVASELDRERKTECSERSARASKTSSPR